MIPETAHSRSGVPGSHLIHGLLDPFESTALNVLDRFSRFCSAHDCDQQTQTDRPRYVGNNGPHLILRIAMRSVYNITKSKPNPVTLNINPNRRRCPFPRMVFFMGEDVQGAHVQGANVRTPVLLLLLLLLVNLPLQ